MTICVRKRHKKLEGGAVGRAEAVGTIAFIAGFSATRQSTSSCEALFSIVADLEGHRRWARDDLTVTADQTGGYTSRAVVAGRDFNARIEVEDIRRPDRFVFRVEDETGVYRHSFEFEPGPHGCRVTRRVEPVSLNARQRLLYWVALFPVRLPALRVSLSRLTDSAESTRF